MLSILINGCIIFNSVNMQIDLKNLNKTCRNKYRKKQGNPLPDEIMDNDGD